jgi:hypothetical protein
MDNKLHLLMCSKIDLTTVNYLKQHVDLEYSSHNRETLLKIIGSFFGVFIENADIVLVLCEQ